MRDFALPLKCMTDEVQKAKVEKIVRCYTKSRYFSTTKPHIFEITYADTKKRRIVSSLSGNRAIRIRVHDLARMHWLKHLLEHRFLNNKMWCAYKLASFANNITFRSFHAT